MNEIYIILSNIDENPYSPVMVYSHWNFHLENFLGFLNGFSFNILKRFEQIETLPKNSIKLFLNLCALPIHPHIHLNKRHIDYINNDKNSYMWIFSPHEYKLREEELISALSKLKVKFEKVIITNSNDTLYRKKIHNIKFCPFSEWWEAYYKYNLNTVKNTSFISPDKKKLTINSANKKFISLNRNYKIHRVWFYQSLIETKFSKEGHVSYHLPRIANEQGLNFQSWIDNGYKKYNILNKHKKIFENKNLDTLTDTFVINNQESIEPYYQDSVLSFTTESLEDHNFITEKTFKAITHSQPFILIGNKGINNVLKKRGYKTFEDFFGYDEISSYSESLSVMNKIKKIPLEKIKDIVINDLMPRIEYNWNHFFSRDINFNTLLSEIDWLITNDKQ